MTIRRICGEGIASHLLRQEVWGWSGGRVTGDDIVDRHGVGRIMRGRQKGDDVTM